jgi:uncharacterized protein
MDVNYRRCVACRKVAPKHYFWRVVRVYPSHEVSIEQGAGRSAYLCPESSCLKDVQKKNRLSKALKAPVPDELLERLAKRLQE